MHLNLSNSGYDKITARVYGDENEVRLDALARILTLDTHWTAKLVPSEDDNALLTCMKILSHSCDSWYWLGGLGILWLLSEGEVRIQALFWALCILALAGLVLLIKALIRRPRPEGEWGKIYRIADPHSFPSGHAARAMGLAVLAVQSGSAWVVAGFMFWAVLVGLSRITLKLHYLLDVVAGWLIGAAGGALALQLYPWFSQTIKALLH